MEEDDYFLKWEKHHSAFVSVFDYLHKHNILVDCTLTAEEKHINAHRIVLMACSPYLQKLLCEHSENYPIVVFDIKYSELEAIVNFCYRGEVKVPYNELEGFLEAASMLQIKGLCKTSESEVSDNSDEKQKRRLSVSGVNTEGNSCKKKKISNCDESDNRISANETEDVAADEPAEPTEKAARNGYPSQPLAMVSVKSEPDLLNTPREVQGSDNSDVDSDDTGGSSGPEEVDHINEFLNSSSTLLFPWTCNRCGEAFATRAPYEEHRRNCARFDTSNHPWKCQKCPNAYKNKKDLVRHLIYCGNETPRLYCNRCGNSYKYERGLRRHQKYCGTDVKPLKCPQCEKTYKYKRGLRRHQRRCGIAEALQFLAGKGVTPVVVTKRTLGLPYLGEIAAKAGLPMITPKLSQLSQLGSAEGGLKPSETPEHSALALTPSVENSEASVCHCGKVYKYKKSYDKHIASCLCSTPQQVAELAKKRNSRETNQNDNDELRQDLESNKDSNEETQELDEGISKLPKDIDGDAESEIEEVDEEMDEDVEDCEKANVGQREEVEVVKSNREIKKVNSEKRQTEVKSGKGEVEFKEEKEEDEEKEDEEEEEEDEDEEKEYDANSTKRKTKGNDKEPEEWLEEQSESSAKESSAKG